MIKKAGKHDLYFTKAVASGNDFIILDNISGELDPRDIDHSVLAEEICRRKFSVGADGLLVLESSDRADIRMRIINPDGSEVEMCGNGARCSAHYASICGFGKNIDIETKAGIIRSVVSSGRVKLDMGKPHALELDLNLGIGQNMLVTHSINTGVPHVVHIVEEGLDTYDVEKIGRAIRQHPHFAPEGTNANFAETLDRSSAMIRTYERGVEQETLACGTGTTAAALILGILGYVDPPVKMLTKSGEELTVHFELDGSSVKNVFLEGESRMVFEGKI